MLAARKSAAGKVAIGFSSFKQSAMFSQGEEFAGKRINNSALFPHSPPSTQSPQKTRMKWSFWVILSPSDKGDRQTTALPYRFPDRNNTLKGIKKWPLKQVWLCLWDTENWEGKSEASFDFPFAAGPSSPHFWHFLVWFCESLERSREKAFIHLSLPRAVQLWTERAAAGHGWC